MNSQQVLLSIVKAAKKLIVSKEFAGAHRIGNAFSRKGKLSFHNMIYYVLHSTHKSLSINYADLRNILLCRKLPFVSRQALSKARQGISHEAFAALFRLFVEQYYRYSRNLKLWNGYLVYAVDGSTVQIPETKENMFAFGSNPNSRDVDSPLASISALYDVMNDILVDVTLDPYRRNERDSAKEHMTYLPGFPNSIILFDRGYPSEDLFRFLDEKGVFFLMRIPRTFKKLIPRQSDDLFTYPKTPSSRALTVRCVRFELDNGNTEYLVTNLKWMRLDSLICTGFDGELRANIGS